MSLTCRGAARCAPGPHDLKPKHALVLLRFMGTAPSAIRGCGLDPTQSAPKRRSNDKSTNGIDIVQYPLLYSPMNYLHQFEHPVSVAPITLILSITPTLPFSIEIPTTSLQGTCTLFRKHGGVPPKSEYQAKPLLARPQNSPFTPSTPRQLAHNLQIPGTRYSPPRTIPPKQFPPPCISTSAQSNDRKWRPKWPIVSKAK